MGDRLLTKAGCSWLCRCVLRCGAGALAALWALAVLRFVSGWSPSPAALSGYTANSPATPVFNLSATDAAAFFDERDYEMFRFIFDWLETPTSPCRDLRTFGGRPGAGPSGVGPRRSETSLTRYVGGNKVCFDAPMTINTPASCLVYSFGAEDDWSFERAMVRHGCEVHAFDPRADGGAEAVTAGVHFRKAALHAKSGIVSGMQLLTLDTIIQVLGHQDVPIQYLKLDIDFSEEAFLRQQLTSKFGGTFVLDAVEQIWIEIHLPLDVTSLRQLKLLGFLERAFRNLNQLGFGVAYTAPDLTENGRLYLFPGVDRPVRAVYQVLLVRAGPDSWSREDRDLPSRLDLKFR